MEYRTRIMTLSPKVIEQRFITTGMTNVRQIIWRPGAEMDKFVLQLGSSSRVHETEVMNWSDYDLLWTNMRGQYEGEYIVPGGHISGTIEIPLAGGQGYLFLMTLTARNVSVDVILIGDSV